jgi:hypothetical protein
VTDTAAATVDGIEIGNVNLICCSLEELMYHCLITRYVGNYDVKYVGWKCLGSLRLNWKVTTYRVAWRHYMNHSYIATTGLTISYNHDLEVSRL